MSIPSGFLQERKRERWGQKELNDRGRSGEGQELSNWQVEKRRRYYRLKGGKEPGRGEVSRDGWLVRMRLEMRWLKTCEDSYCHFSYFTFIGFSHIKI